MILMIFAAMMARAMPFDDMPCLRASAASDDMRDTYYAAPAPAIFTSLLFIFITPMIFADAMLMMPADAMPRLIFYAATR